MSKVRAGRDNYVMHFAATGDFMRSCFLSVGQSLVIVAGSMLYVVGSRYHPLATLCAGSYVQAIRVENAHPKRSISTTVLFVVFVVVLLVCFVGLFFCWGAKS